MKKRELLHQGKVKSVWATPDPGLCIIEFSDAITAGDGAKKAVLPGKGALLNKISALLFTRLAEAGIANHFVALAGSAAMLARRARLLPLEVVVRNRTAGSICRRLGLEPNLEIVPPLVEFFWKNDRLHDPLLTREHIALLQLATPQQCDAMASRALAVNRVLKEIFAAAGLDLVDFKLEFGVAGDELLLIDEISPDTCRLWRAGAAESLDKDRFRNDSGDVLEGYREVLKRLEEAQCRN